MYLQICVMKIETLSNVITIDDCLFDYSCVYNRINYLILFIIRVIMNILVSSYAIGKEYPISVYINTFNTNKVHIGKIYDYVNKNFNFSVDNIIKELDLLNPIYYNLAAYGHFGRTDLNLTWEQIKS